MTPLLQARIDGSPLVVKGRTKPFAKSRESEIALSLDGLDVPHMAFYAPGSVPVAVKSGKLSTALNVSFAISCDTPTIRIDGTADLADLAVIDRANTPLVAARALHVKIANAEPLRDIYRLDEVTLSNPDVHLARDSAGQLNVQKLAGPPPKPEEKKASGEQAKKEAPPLDLAIRHLAIDDGRIALDDQLLKQRVQGALTGLAVTLDSFSTLSKTPAKYTLKTKTAFDHGGALDASGNVTLAAKTADAKLALNGFVLPPLQPYLANVVAGRVTSGTLGANLPVSVDWSKPDGGVRVGAGEVKLDALTFAPNESGVAPVKLASATAKIGKIDVSARNASLESVQLTGLSLDATRRKDGSIDLASLAGPHEAAPEQNATHKIQKAQAGPAWHYQIGQIALEDASASVTDETFARPVKLRVAPLALSVKQFSDDLAKPLAVDGKLTLNGRGALAIGGNLTVSPLKLALHVKGDQVDVSAFEPYFGDKLNIDVASANLSANGDVAMSGSGKTLATTYKGDVSLSDVRMIDKLTNDRFAGWKLLGLTNVKVSYDERGTDVDAARVTFANFYGRVLLDSQGRLNLKGMVANENGTTQPVTKERRKRRPRPLLPPLRPGPRRNPGRRSTCAWVSSCCRTAA
ncbi:putative exported protein [Candidatus Paraburkholderia schumanniana]|nr:putative exported protein [Candidatus Paraburkholderia schumannianae]